MSFSYVLLYLTRFYWRDWFLLESLRFPMVWSFWRGSLNYLFGNVLGEFVWTCHSLWECVWLWEVLCMLDILAILPLLRGVNEYGLCSYTRVTYVTKKNYWRWRPCGLVIPGHKYPLLKQVHDLLKSIAKSAINKAGSICIKKDKIPRKQKRCIYMTTQFVSIKYYNG